MYVCLYVYICIYVSVCMCTCVWGWVRSFSVVSTFAGTENRRGDTAGGRKDSQVRGKGCGVRKKGQVGSAHGMGKRAACDGR